MPKHVKTEHAGAKNGGGHWGKREEAKRLSKSQRRADDREVVRKELGADVVPEWRCSDGTVVRLGGEVVGDSELASVLRADVAQLRRGYVFHVPTEAMPSPTVPIDLDEPRLVDTWLRTRAAREHVDVVSSPLPAPSEPDDDDGLDEDGRQRVY